MLPYRVWLGDRDVRNDLNRRLCNYTEIQEDKECCNRFVPFKRGRIRDHELRVGATAMNVLMMARAVGVIMPVVGVTMGMAFEPVAVIDIKMREMKRINDPAVKTRTCEDGNGGDEGCPHFHSPIHITFIHLGIKHFLVLEINGLMNFAEVSKRLFLLF